MARVVVPLTDAKIKKAKPKNKVFYLRDGGGLNLQVNPSGSKIWMIDYVNPITKKRSTKTIGHYPYVSLKEAREERDAFKASAKDKRTFTKAKNKNITFGEVANLFFEKMAKEKSERYTVTEKGRYNMHLKSIAKLPIAEVDKNAVLDIAKLIQAKGNIEQGHRVFALARRILDFAVANDIVETNVLFGVQTRVVLQTPSKKNNYAHITDKKEFAQLLRDIDNYYGSILVKIALQIAPYVFVRPANLRMMEWSEIDFEERTWTIPAEKMKMDNAHIVPLTDRVIELLKQTEEFKQSKYVFYSPTTTLKPLSENAVNQALQRLGYKDKMTGHGFRHTASTLLHENIHIHGIPSEVIELQLAHTDRNSIRAVYNKAKFLDLRFKLMEWWSDYVDELRKP